MMEGIVVYTFLPAVATIWLPMAGVIMSIIILLSKVVLSCMGGKMQTRKNGYLMAFFFVILICSFYTC